MLFYFHVFLFLNQLPNISTNRRLPSRLPLSPTQWLPPSPRGSPLGSAAPRQVPPLSTYRALSALQVFRGRSTSAPLLGSVPGISRPSKVGICQPLPRYYTGKVEPSRGRGAGFPSGRPHSIPRYDVQMLIMFIAQLPSPSPSGRLGPSTRPRDSRTRMASRARSSATSRPPLRAASSTAMSRPHTPPLAWPSGTASSWSGTGPSSATPSPTASGSTT